ncbi:MAG: L,D-transpeptidase [Clostridiales Family XIII bacterium]|jgi:lipoprotein-anchoring transpeptidase ErfK/SrfK|nr:L,D-transpeptidase [Clostridiales Family XIII bacterium]
MSLDNKSTENNNIAIIKPKRKKAPIILLIILILLLLVATAIAAYGAYFKDKAAPGTILGSVKLAGMSDTELQKRAMDTFNNANLHFDLDGQSVTATPGALGLSLDSKQTSTNVLGFKSANDFCNKLKFYEPKEMKLIVNADYDQARAFFTEAYAGVLTTASEPSVNYNAEAESYSVTPGIAGNNISQETVDRICDEITQNINTEKAFKLTSSELAPLITDADAQATCDKANIILDSNYTFTLNDKVVANLSRDTKAGLMTFAQDLEQKQIIMSPVDENIQPLVSDNLAKMVSIQMLQKVVVIKNGAEFYVIKNGRDGQNLIDQENLIKAIHDAIVADTELTTALTVETVPRDVKQIVLGPDTHWVEVNLTEQKTYLYTGDTRVAEYLISSGKNETPTVTGGFLVERQYVKDTMKGSDPTAPDYYVTEDVPWCTYFYGGYAFHGAPWHNNFGHQMSHGCINMRVAEAEAVYHFAPVGTFVWVHN